MSGLPTRRGLRRVMAAGALLVFALMLPLSLLFAGTEERVRSSVLALGAMEIGLLWGALAALWLPALTGRWPSTLPRALARGLGMAIAVWLAVSLAGAIALPWARPIEAGDDSWARVSFPVAIAAFAALATLFSFCLCRLVARAWAAWNRRRRTRLRWALTHGLLVVSLIVAVIAGALLTAADAGGNFPDADLLGFTTMELAAPQRAIALVIVRFVPSALALFVVSLLVGIVIVPPVAAISFPVLGHATRRLEDLSRATAALRAGDLDARSPVAGEDEIARLQADFNAMAADLQRAQEQLRAERDAVAALLDNRRELVAAVSHELRTPLATVRGYLDSALAHWQNEPPPTLRHDLEIMTREAERVQRLIDDLFALSRAEIDRLPMAVIPADVGPLLQRIAEATSPLAWQRGKVEVLARFPEDLPKALVDPARLEQAIRNLVTNAVRHTPPGGVVLLTVEQDGAAVIVRVKDTGAGIPAADLPFIWDRFYRGEREPGQPDREHDREGAGLGLALVKELTEAMGGAVAVESAPGEGSCFSLRLPIA